MGGWGVGGGELPQWASEWERLGLVQEDENHRDAEPDHRESTTRPRGAVETRWLFNKMPNYRKKLLK